MKKKLISFALVLAVLASNLVIWASGNNTVTLPATGYNNVTFSNGYTGFCMDRDLDVGYAGDGFAVADTGSANSNVTGANIAQYLKILFVDHFEELFVADGNGGYVIENPAFTQGYVYAFTDRDSSWWDYEPLLSVVNAYNNGRRIPDSGEKIEVDNVTVTFDFMVLLSTRTDIEQQDFFAFKLTVGPQEHQHNFGGEWQKDDANHWKQCSCNEKDQLNPHSGGTANCGEGAICEVCGKEYTSIDLQNHVGGTELRGYKVAKEFEDGYSGDTYCLTCGNMTLKGHTLPATHTHNFSGEWQKDDANHWKQCSCNEIDQQNIHSGGTANCGEGAICEVCGKEYTNTDTENHVGGTALRGYKEAKEFEDGYSGDVYCLTCANLIEEGEVIPATHVHDFGEEWKSGKESHWHECSCGDYQNFEKHEFKDGKCVICQSPDPSGMTPDTGSDFDVWMWSALTAVSAMSLVALKKKENLI